MTDLLQKRILTSFVDVIIYQTQETPSHQDIQTAKRSLKYDAWWSIFDEISGVQIDNEPLSRVFDIFSIKTKNKELAEVKLSKSMLREHAKQLLGARFYFNYFTTWLLCYLVAKTLIVF